MFLSQWSPKGDPQFAKFQISGIATMLVPHATSSAPRCEVVRLDKSNRVRVAFLNMACDGTGYVKDALPSIVLKRVDVPTIHVGSIKPNHHPIPGWCISVCAPSERYDLALHKRGPAAVVLIRLDFAKPASVLVRQFL